MSRATKYGKSLLIFGGCVVALLGVDFFIMWLGYPSFSRSTLRLAQQLPIVTFLTGMFVGVLAGHFWWPMRQ